MLAIVAHHYAVHGGVLLHTESANTGVFLLVFGGFGKWGVDLFVLVGAFYMLGAARRGKALSTIYSQLIPISWGLAVGAMIVTGAVLPWEDLRGSLFPVIFSQYWFVTAYVVLILMAPYLAIIVERLTELQLRRLILVGLVMWSGLSLIDGVGLGIANLGWFALLFLIAAYVRVNEIPGSARTWGIASLASGALLTLTLLVAGYARWDYAGTADALSWVVHNLAEQHSPVVLAFAVTVFVWALKSRPWKSRVLNYWATAAFGVYLIHDNPLTRRVLWRDIVETSSAAGQWWLPLHAVAWTLVVFVVASVVIFVLRPTVFAVTHKVTEAVRMRVENWLKRGPEDAGPSRRLSES